MNSADGVENIPSAITKNKLCYIIHNWKFRELNYRERSKVDFESLKNTFEKLNFTVESLENATGNEILNSLKEVSNREDLKDYSMFVCIILSYGDENVIYGTDDEVKIDKLLKNFKGDECEGLRGKPKLFFIQACRGEKQCNTSTIPTEEDFLIGYSTLPGCVSYQHQVNGGPYIQALCEVLETHARTEDIVNILTKVNSLVADKVMSIRQEEHGHQMKQVPTFTSTLRQKVWMAEDHE